MMAIGMMILQGWALTCSQGGANGGFCVNEGEWAHSFPGLGGCAIKDRHEIMVTRDAGW